MKIKQGHILYTGFAPFAFVIQAWANSKVSNNLSIITVLSRQIKDGAKLFECEEGRKTVYTVFRQIRNNEQLQLEKYVFEHKKKDLVDNKYDAWY